MRDTNDFESDGKIQLEEEMDRIIMLADSFDGRALTTRQILSAKRQNGLKNLRRNFSLVHKKKQKKTQSSCTAKVPLLLHKQPRLSPLAARAALAASVTPLKQARQVILFKKSQELSAHSARCKVCTSCVVVAEDDPRNLHVFLKEKDQNTSVAVATTKQGFRSTSSCSSIKETGGTLVNRCACEKNDVELIIDIPIYEDLLTENAIDFTIDIPIFEI